MDWLTLLKLLLRVISLVTQKAQEKGQLDAGAAQAIVISTNDVERRVRAALDARTGKLPDEINDPNNRDH